MYDLGSKYKGGRISSGHPRHPRVITGGFVGSNLREHPKANNGNNKLVEYREEILKDRGMCPLIIMIMKSSHIIIIQYMEKV